MTQHELSPDQVKRQAKQATREASPWIEPLGRIGYAVKGVVFLVIGWLALQSAIGPGGETTDNEGAVRRLTDLPLGNVLLVIVAVGFVGFGLWRVVQAFLDTEAKGSDAKGYLMRVGYVIVGLSYFALAIFTTRLLLGQDGGSSTDTQQSWIARVMAQPFGPWLVGLGGAIVVGVGLYLIYKGYSARFRRELNLDHMSQTETTWAVRVGRLGYAALGIVFAIVGFLIIIAAIRTDPGEARGFEGALQTLAAQPYGPWLLGIVAIGLIAYGLYSFVEARYRRMIMR
jgi:hypothetical protein